MFQNGRISTDQNFKNKIIFNSSSLGNIKWGKKNNTKERKSLIDSVTVKNLLNKNIKRESTSESTEKEKNEKEKDSEEEKRRKEELSKRREMSYRARKRIILRMRQEEKNEQKNEKPKESDKKKLRKFEIKFPLDKIKLRRLNSNDFINFNSNRQNIEPLQQKTIGTENEHITKNIIDNKTKSQKENFILNRNIRNLYKKNMIKDINVLTEKSCKILKVEKIFMDKNNTDKDNNDNKKKSGVNLTNINVNVIKKKENNNQGTLDQKKSDETKIAYNDNKKLKNKNITLKFLEGRRNRNFFANMKPDITSNDLNDNNCFIFSSIKNFSRINSEYNLEYLDNPKKSKIFNGKENTKMKEESNTEKNDYNEIKRKRLRNGSENRILKNFSFFGCFRPQKKNNQNEDKKDIENEIKSPERLKVNLLKHNSFKTSEKSKEIVVNLRTLSDDYLDLNQNNNNNIKVNKIDNEENSDEFNPKLYMIHYFEELIEINNAMNDRNLLKTLLNNFNQKYFLNNGNYNKSEYKIFFKENENFEYIFKHFGLVLICLIFFAKDNLLFSEFNAKVKDLLLQLIYSSLNYVEMDGNKDSNKINNFINDNNIQSVIPNHRYIFSLICLLFDNKKDYVPLKNALEQLHEIITKKDYQYLTEVMNNSILYCYNTKPKYLFSFSIFKPKNSILSVRDNPELQNNDPNSNNNNIITSDNIPSIPFIRTPMKKKFCLVLDIDETISHSLKLSFGFYFLVRPGALDFLKEVSKYYEIIIFTSSPKSYADKILNKIDINGNLISHRLYRNHVTYENGKSVKKLNMIGRDLTKTIFIDNLRSNAKYNLNNLCPISSWISDIFDERLIKLKNKLIYIATSGKYDDDITQGL